jgi:hypothetical protein
MLEAMRLGGAVVEIESVARARLTSENAQRRFPDPSIDTLPPAGLTGWLCQRCCVTPRANWITARCKAALSAPSPERRRERTEGEIALSR